MTLFNYRHISAPAFGEKNNLIMEQDCYLYQLMEEPKPAAEIEALNYFDIESYSHEPAQVPGVIMIMAQLKNDNLLD